MKNKIIKSSILLVALFGSGAFAEQYEIRINADGVISGSGPGTDTDVDKPTENPGTFAGGSCLELQSKNPSMANGVYELDLGAEKISAYCNDGWTLVVAQFEKNPVLWSGNMTQYDPSLASKKGFALPQSKLPKHSSFAVGQGTEVLYRAMNTPYSTGDIGRTIVTDSDGTQYLVHRAASYFYGAHNPDNPIAAGYQEWRNSLTMELYKTNPQNGSALSPKNDFTWAFSPLQTSVLARGYSIRGVDRQAITDDFAWTVWVK